jgi:hypothetical protein
MTCSSHLVDDLRGALRDPPSPLPQSGRGVTVTSE